MKDNKNIKQQKESARIRAILQEDIDAREEIYKDTRETVRQALASIKEANNNKEISKHKWLSIKKISQSSLRYVSVIIILTLVLISSFIYIAVDKANDPYREMNSSNKIAVILIKQQEIDLCYAYLPNVKIENVKDLGMLTLDNYAELEKNFKSTQSIDIYFACKNTQDIIYFYDASSGKTSCFNSCFEYRGGELLAYFEEIIDAKITDAFLNDSNAGIMLQLIQTFDSTNTFRITYNITIENITYMVIYRDGRFDAFSL